jgi:uncharacterized integral membrane protein (TIGR00698 family)
MVSRLVKQTHAVWPGLVFAIFFSILLLRVAQLPWNRGLQLSSLTLAILAGMMAGNLAPARWQERLIPGLRVSQQKLLRLGIVLYGVRLTTSDLVKLGPGAIVLDVLVILSVLFGGYWLGTRILGLDPDTALLVSAGSGICGAAAVLATDRVIESDSPKVSISVATVVVFGTAAMFLYPLLYPFTGLTERQYGVYTGATVHEVAHVVAAGRAISQAASDTAVVTKMLRVLLLAPVLLAVGWSRRNRSAAGSKLTMPWFVLWFLGVILLQSAFTLRADARQQLIDLDTILLGSAMFALGVATRWSQIKTAGSRPLLLGAVLFAALSSGGLLLTRLIQP